MAAKLFNGSVFPLKCKISARAFSIQIYWFMNTVYKLLSFFQHKNYFFQIIYIGRSVNKGSKVNLYYVIEKPYCSPNNTFSTKNNAGIEIYVENGFRRVHHKMLYSVQKKGPSNYRQINSIVRRGTATSTDCLHLIGTQI